MSLSDIAGDRIARYRRRQGVNREEMARRCADILGHKFSADQVANVETGRPRNGARTREITIDEITVIARVLNVKVTDLLDPAVLIGDEDHPTPGRSEADVWGFGS
jgi:transcriptional regulator with XRE-family HTH domain